VTATCAHEPLTQRSSVKRQTMPTNEASLRIAQRGLFCNADCEVTILVLIEGESMHKFFGGVVLSLAAAMGAVQAEPLTTSGIGLASCEKLAADLKPEQGFNHLPNALVYYWVQGYMSAANIATLEGDSDYVDLSKYDEKVILPAIQDFCLKNPGKKPISLIDEILSNADRAKGAWTKGTIKWAAD
jgi:hypothetical protein